MSLRPVLRHGCALASIALGLTTREIEAQPSASSRALERRIDSIAAAAGVVVGVSVRHLETGAHASVRGGERFPMASVFKIPLTVYALSRVERGDLSLESGILLHASDMRLGRSPIADRWPRGRVTLTLRELIDSTVVQSDNSSADVLLRIVGGPSAVTAWLRAQKITAIRVDRSEAELAFDAFGVTKRPPRSKWMLDSMRAAIRRVPAAEQERAAHRFERDPRDTSTPDEMTRLLDGLVRHRWIDVEHSALILRGMRVTTTTPGRLRGALPAATESAHKSGTTATSDSGFTAGVNDVGIITLPGGREHLAVAIFVRARTMTIEDAEVVIARIARAAYDWAP